jgi:hypothetical protein
MAAGDDAAARMAAWRKRNPGRGRNVSLAPGTAGGQILAWLDGHGPARVPEIVAGTGRTYNSVVGNLREAVRRGLAEKPAWGVYGPVPPMWALDLDGDGRPAAAHRIVATERPPGGEEARVSACGLRFTATSHPRGWHKGSRPPVRAHCGRNPGGDAGRIKTG